MKHGISSLLESPDVGQTDASWTSDDAILYALAVGAGLQDPLDELAYTTENSIGVEQVALPTLVTTLGQHEFPVDRWPDTTGILRAEQSLELHRPLPVAGRAMASGWLTGVRDVGSGAVVTLRSELVQGGEPLATMDSGWYVPRAGGFDPGRSASPRWTPPTRPPDAQRDYQTMPGQALLFRLTGDRHPFHSDPTVSRAAGYPQPMLHGLCTLGYAARALIDVACARDPSAFRAISARFTAPVVPGCRLAVLMWDAGPTWQFQVLSDDRTVVVDRGEFALR